MFLNGDDALAFRWRVRNSGLLRPFDPTSSLNAMRNQRLDAESVHQMERRGFPRYPALDNTSQVGWRHDGQLVTSSAQLMDVSRDGMLVLVDDDPPRGIPIMIRLLSPTVTAWFEARVAESQAMHQGPYQLRLVLINGLPPSFFAFAASRYEDVN